MVSSADGVRRTRVQFSAVPLHFRRKCGSTRASVASPRRSYTTFFASDFLVGRRPTVRTSQRKNLRKKPDAHYICVRLLSLYLSVSVSSGRKQTLRQSLTSSSLRLVWGADTWRCWKQFHGRMWRTPRKVYTSHVACEN